MWDKGCVPFRNKHLKLFNAFKDYGWFLTYDDKHVLLNISKDFFRHEAIHCVNAEDHIIYKYIERSLGLNHDEDLQVNANILRATKYGEYALVHPNVRKKYILSRFRFRLFGWLQLF